MINRNTYSLANSLAQTLKDKGLTVVANPNTVLSELVKSSALPFTEPNNGLPEMIEACTGTFGNEESQHSLELSGYVKDLSKIVLSHIDIAKNSVKPIVAELALAIQEYQNINIVKHPAENFNVEICNIPDIAKDENFLDLITSYIDKSSISPDLKFNLNTKIHEELLALMCFGHARTDKLIFEWISSLKGNLLDEIWESFFTIVSDKPVSLNYNAIKTMHVFARLNIGLAFFLLGRKLYDNVDESAEGMSLQNYKATAVEYRDFGGCMVAESLKAINNQTKLNKLIVEVKYYSSSVTVNGELYGPWLTTGGTPEIILGLLVSSDVSSLTGAIDANSKKYTDIWNSYCLYHQTDNSNKEFSNYKNFLASHFNIMLKSPCELEIKYSLKNPTYAVSCNKLAAECIDRLTVAAMKDSYGTALDLIGNCRFFYTSAFDILNDIQKTAIANPNADVREAALIAVINYMAVYMADQISVMKC
jgi:hypothetical protein